MPVAPLSNVTQPQSPPDPGSAAAPPGFAQALAAQLRSAAPARPDQAVTLGQMVAIQASSPADRGALVQSLAASTPAALPPADGPEGLSSGGPVLQTAKRYLGIPYKWGGTDPAKGLDCSGFTQRVFADLGVRIPRVSADQSRAGQAVGSLAEARPGDLVYWKGQNGRPNHIGIYIGGGQMIHAPRTGDVVKVAPVRSAPPNAIRRVV